MNATLDMTQPHHQPSPSEWTDEDLLLEFRRSGNRDCFNLLVKRYERELFQHLFRYLRDVELAEDAFQLTFLAVFRKANQFEAGRRVRPWLYAVATNQAIDARRSDRRHNALSLDRPAKACGDDAANLADLLTTADGNPQANVTGAENREAIRQAVDKLASPYREVINMVYYQGLKYREAADALDLPIGTVKSRAFVALKKLSETLEHIHKPQT